MEQKNNSILIVDDEKDILSTYKKVLEDSENNGDELFNMVKNRFCRKNIIENIKKVDKYRILTANSGEEAVDIVRAETDEGRRIAVGFFDMVMPGGMDGIATIQAVKNIDKDILCAIVTAHTNHSLEGIDSIFALPSEWIYFNKPFTKWELRQCARNLLDMWNLKKREHEYKWVIKEKNSLLNNQKNTLTRLMEFKVKNIERQKYIMTAQYNFSSRLSSIKSIDMIIKAIIEFTQEMLRCERVSIMLEEGGYLTIKGSAGINPKIAEKVCIPIGEGISGTVFQKKFPMITKDLAELKNLKRIDIDGTSFISVPMILSSTGDRNEIIGVINVTNKIDDEPFEEEDLNILTYICNTSSIAISNHIKTARLEQSYLDIIKTMALVIEAKDPYTKGHSERVMEYANGIAVNLGLSEDKIRLLDQISLLHDIGKISIPESIINKNGKLTDEEYSIIKSHAAKGFEMISHLTHLKSGHLILKHHHERLNGKGYPDGLKEEDIELEAKILAVADSYDAMTSNRPYRKAMDRKIAIKELRSSSGTQLDEVCVEAFLKYLNDFDRSKI